MRPVTDKHRVSRAKLAYIIDATAAPVCIIAPISSWAAAVSGFVEDGKGLSLFIRAIPYNFYALFTIAMMVMLVVLRVDYGPMAKSEALAGEGDLFGVPENSSGITGPENATASAKRLIKSPACGMLTPKRSARSGKMPITPISVLIMLNTPMVKINIIKLPFDFNNAFSPLKFYN